MADTVDGFVRMATHDAAVGQEVNIGADSTISIDELAQKVLRIIGRELPIVTEERGFDQVTMAVGYLAELLMAYCGDGSKFRFNLSYSREESPLGTAGPLALIDGLRHDDYEQAVEEFEAMQPALLGGEDHRAT